MILKIKELRKKRHLSQKDLAEMAGISVSYLSEIESGKKSPNMRRIAQLAQAIGVRPLDLLTTDQFSEELKNHIVALGLLTEDQQNQIFQHAEALAFQKSVLSKDQ